MTLPREVLCTTHVAGERVFWSMRKMVFDETRGASVVVPAKFLSDGLSIPKIFQSIFSKSPHFIYAGILHDYLYRADGHPWMSRKAADVLFLQYMRLYGVGWLTRRMIYTAVRVGGARSYKVRLADYFSEGSDNE